MSSRAAPILSPNDPPMSPARTLTFSWGMPSAVASTIRAMWTPWVAEYTVSSSDSASKLHTTPRHSMGTFWWRC